MKCPNCESREIFQTKIASTQLHCKSCGKYFEIFPDKVTPISEISEAEVKK